MNLPDANAVISDTNLISFSGISREDRADILDLMMYADFSASQTWRREENWTSWIDYYRKRLEACGCRLRTNIVKQPMVISSAAELDNLSFGVVGSVAVSGLLQLARRSIKGARISQYAQHFFAMGQSAQALSTFQIVPCEATASGEVSILVCGLYASATTSSEGRGGDWGTDRQMVVRLAGSVYSFSQAAYGPYRERVRTHFENRGPFNIKHISI